MREIKFRVFYKRENMMIEWESLKVLLEGYEDPFVTTDDWKVMQFTGLFDKNGKEIYEGDIIRNGPYLSIIIWCDKCIGWQYAWDDYVIDRKACNMCGGNFDITEIYENGISYEDDEVIGNIYEHPNLLESEDK